MLTAMNVPDVNEIIPDPEDEEPKDPATENMYLIMGKPTKVYMWQDHEAHIITHMSAADDPKLTGALSRSPAAPAMQAALAAHVTEHVAYAYRRKIEENMGVPMPNPDEPLPKSIETSFSKVVAEAAKKTLQGSIAEQKNIQARQDAQDPLIQMQQRELAIKEMDAQRRGDESKARLEIDSMKAMSDIETKTHSAQVDEVEVAIKLISTMLNEQGRSQDLQSRQQVEAAKAGIETVKMVLSSLQSLEGVEGIEGIEGEIKNIIPGG